MQVEKELVLNLHVSSNTVLIIRRSNFINTTSGIVRSVSDRPVCRLRRNQSCVQVEKELVPSQPAHQMVTYREFYTKCCINTIQPPDDKHSDARNM